ncbi:membrane protein [Rhodoferax saidenbachensis]|uniref:Glycosyltransferase n=1 Tax=Rhodoferax saidenbachensis TaxID=1484693 RepID=A0A1P8K8S1_9BURK|nr:membrane protein [Rhodoferax saidenbachensis]APW42380.1 hypothetical protein RS694_07380 [Rhodoferax saidenbachensis]
MNHPNPAIVAQAAVRRLPRFALLLFCVAYVLSGFIGREAWKSADMAALGFMDALAHGSAQWLKPTLAGMSAETPGLLPYWLGAWAIQVAPAWIPADFAARIPFGLLLALTFLGCWYGTYYLARRPQAQPVAFAFGGEALPADYARAMADGGLLALIACLGLAQLSHETTPALAQLGFTALFFYAMAALPYRRVVPALGAVLGLLGLALSGAPAMAVLFGLGSSLVHALDRPDDTDSGSSNDRILLESTGLVLLTVCVGMASTALDLWSWKITLPHAQWSDWNGYAQLLLWFTWPAGPLALWTVWRWRHQLFRVRTSRHLALPVWFVAVTVAATLSTGSSDRSLLLALPALAALAAFALPTLKRQVAALIDWFTLLFFSGCGFIIWVVWLAMQTGFPTQPAANVARLAPGFEARFSTLAFAIAVLATIAWAWLVKWRVGRHRAAIWKSLVLPGCGAALCWLLLMTLWMPLLNYSLSYNTLVTRTVKQLGPTDCVEVFGQSQGQIAAFQVYGKLKIMPMQIEPVCNWLLVEPGPDMAPPLTLDQTHWVQHAVQHHPADGNESVLIFRRR